MHRLISKRKILAYIVFLLLLTTFYNEDLKINNFFKIKYIIIKEENIETDYLLKKKILNTLKIYKDKNIIFINKKKFEKKISENKWISNFSVKKRYPSTLIINYKKAKPIANIIIDQNFFFIGSNFKLLKSENLDEKLPNIFGNPKMTDLKDLFEEIYLSKFNFEEITDFYYLKSGRWDIKTNKDVVVKLPNNNILDYLNLAKKIIDSKEILIKNIINLTVKNQIIIN